MASIELLLKERCELDARIVQKEQEWREAINDVADPRIIGLAASLQDLRNRQDATNKSLISLSHVAQAQSSAASESKPLQAIEQFLDDKDWWLDGHGEKDPMMLLAGEQLPRQGRREELQNIWRSVNALFNSKKGRRALYYLHASAGVGKTYVLRELLKRIKQDIPKHLRKLADEVKFAVVNFNSDTKPPDNGTALPSWFLPLFSLTLRLIFSNCVKPNVSWDTFLSAVFRANIDTASLELEAVLALLQVRSGKPKLVVLVDEIRNANDIQPGYAEELRKLLCRAQDSQNAALNCMVLFSTLDEVLMTREGGVKHKTGTERPVIAATGLPLFTPAQTTQLLGAELPPDGYRNHRGHEVSKDLVMRFLAAFTGGHGRCIQFVLEAIREQRSTHLHQSKLEHVVDEAIHKCGSVYAELGLPVLKLVLLGKQVLKSMAVPGMDCQVTDLVTRGQLIDSFPDATQKWMTPSVPEIFLHQWVRANKNDPTVADLHNDLSAILDLRWNFVAEDWECFHARWETLIRRCRADYQADFSDISLLELYGKPRHSAKTTDSAIWNTRVDASVTVEINGNAIAWSDMTPEQLHGICWLPPDPQNAGFDALRFYPALGSQRDTVLVFFENKFSKKDATTRLTSSEVDSKYSHCAAFVEQHFGSKQFVLIFVSLRLARANAISSAPENCRFLLREELARLYGPTLMRFVESLDGDLGRTTVQGTRGSAGAVRLGPASPSSSTCSAPAALGSGFSWDEPASEQTHSRDGAGDGAADNRPNTMPKRDRRSTATPSASTAEDEPDFVMVTADDVGPDTFASTAERGLDQPAFVPKSTAKRVQVQSSTGPDAEAKVGTRAKRQKR